MREEPTTDNNHNNGSSSPPPPPPQALVERLKDYGQEDAFAFWDQLSANQQNFLVYEIVGYVWHGGFRSFWKLLALRF
ncbi:putative UDP-N-acetylglucosamine diphosphorylase [Helianthus annuus]|nr:putative UDP-N-acetylglucosamine diphosphorylase [Helianthus annuus]KAJ0832146.1 putative UDP-N-acetylglucosamine diphosphorylase [Helianthus annuus]